MVGSPDTAMHTAPPVPTALGPVEETMLITLWARAEEAVRADAIARDEHAPVLRRAIRYDFDRFRHGWKSQVGVAVRTRRIDDLVRRHLGAHDAPVVVNIGAGLDTRFARVDDGRVRWFDLDAPAAVAFRRHVCGDDALDTPRYRLRAASLLDPAWLPEIDVARPEQVLVIAEGVLMFFPAHEIRALLTRLAARFPGGGLVFDGIGALMVRVPRLHDTLPRTRARFRWGTSPSELARFLDATPGCSLRSARTLLDGHRRRWRWMAAVNAVPWMSRQFYLARVAFDYPALSS